MFSEAILILRSAFLMADKRLKDQSMRNWIHALLDDLSLNPSTSLFLLSGD